MKIELINTGDEAEQQYGNVTILRSLRSHGSNTIPETFVIDTGSPKTVIPYDKALRLQIPLNKKHERIICLGGSKYKAYEINNLEFIMADEKGNKVIEPFSCIVLKLTSKKQEEELGHFPIIIGIDFLRERKYNLIMDFERERFYIEKFSSAY